MSTEYKEFDTTAVPTLTLDPFGAEEPKQAPAAVKEPEVQEIQLTPEEQAVVDNFAKQIDLTNSNAILQYGAGAQKKMADFSETALQNVKSQELGEIGDVLSKVVVELKNFDAEEEKGFLGIFKKSANKINAMKAKYAKAEANVDQIVEVLEKHQITLMKDTAMLDKMYETNLAYFKELNM